MRLLEKYFKMFMLLKAAFPVLRKQIEGKCFVFQDAPDYLVNFMAKHEPTKKHADFIHDLAYEARIEKSLRDRKLKKGHV